MGGPWCVTSPLSISLSHNAFTASQTLPRQMPQEPAAPEQPAACEQPTASEEPAAPAPAVSEEPEPSRQPGKLKNLPPKPPAEDEDTAMAVDDPETAKVSITIFPSFSDCIGRPLSTVAGSERLPTQLPLQDPLSVPLRPHNHRPKLCKARMPTPVAQRLGPRHFLSSLRCVLFINSVHSSKSRVLVR